MPRQPRDTRPASEQVAWVQHLPNQGGEWGQGLTRVVASFEGEAKSLETDLERKQAEYDAAVAKLRSAFEEQKTRLTQGITARRRLALDAVKRADKEVTMLYADAQIQHAKTKAARGRETQETGTVEVEPGRE